MTKFCWDVIDRIYDVITFIAKYLYFKKGWVAIFADITKILTVFIITIMYQNTIYICISWYSKFRWFPVKKCWCQQNSRVVSRYLLWERYNCAKFHHCRICVTDFRRGGLFAPPIREQPRKSPSWICLNAYGFSLPALKLLQSYLSNKKQRSKINSEFSSRE